MQPTVENKSVNRIGLIFLLLGGLFTFIVCSMIAAGIFLDIFGTETAGEMTNISYDAARSDNPFTAQVTFTTADGEERSFISWQDRFYFELDERIQRSGAASTAYAGVKVHYLESYPALAKVSFVYHIEYINRVIWLFWSGVALLIGVISRRNKPITIDLSQRKN
jgi:hypothetical protein